ncbi:acyl carrier protein [Parafrankia sp. CH37]|uniref:acyl carrier protein n=1 Tax=Parafrankia sp. CH37 TaxID=683308 RepID=UPI001041F269|nr:acyl carrier protein [Parafrankia sp. CH37]
MPASNETSNPRPEDLRAFVVLATKILRFCATATAAAVGRSGRPYKEEISGRSDNEFMEPGRYVPGAGIRPVGVPPDPCTHKVVGRPPAGGRSAVSQQVEDIEIFIIDIVSQRLEVPVEEIPSDAAIGSFGIDSFGAVEIAVALKNTYDVLFVAGEIGVDFTIADIAVLAVEKLAQPVDVGA